MKTILNIVLSIFLIILIIISNSVSSVALGEVINRFDEDGKLMVSHYPCSTNPYQEKIDKHKDTVKDLECSIKPLGSMQSIIFRVVGECIIYIIAEQQPYYQ